MPRVSVVITCYNYGRFLTEAVRSAQLQTLSDVEIVVVDDGSTDSTAEIADSLGVTVIRQEHRGVAAARNRGIAATDSQFVALLDADDVWQQNKLELQAVAMRSRGLALCHTNGVLLYGDGREQRRRRSRVPPERGCPFAHLLPDRRIYASSALLDRGHLAQAGPFDETLDRFDDLEMWFRLASYGDFRFVGERLFKHRMHGGNLEEHLPCEGKLPVLRERVLARWDVVAGRFEGHTRARYRRLLRRDVAHCYSAQGAHLARTKGRLRALGAHASAIGTFPWSARAYLRMLATLVAGR